MYTVNVVLQFSQVELSFLVMTDASPPLISLPSSLLLAVSITQLHHQHHDCRHWAFYEPFVFSAETLRIQEPSCICFQAFSA